MSKRTALLPLAGAAALILAATPAPGAKKKCPTCDDIPRMQRELREQEVARDAFREFTYDFKDNKVGMRRANSVKDLQAQHAALFKQMMGSGKSKGGGNVVAKPALGLVAPDCYLVEYVGNKEVPLDEEAYREKNCVFADYLIAHEKEHVKQCEYAKANGLFADWEKSVNAAEREVKSYQVGIDLLEAQIAKLKSECVVSTYAPAPSDEAFASRPDIPELEREAQRAASALAKGTV
jgi:hypothetical protein